MANFDKKSLDEFGRNWIKFIREEIKKDALKSTFIPRSKEFYNSFSYEISPDGNVEIYSSWPWVDIIVDGAPRYKMAWLTQARGLNVVPLMQRDGSMVFRTVPLTIGKAWIHPKIAAHTFINRAFDRAIAISIGDIVTKVIVNASTNRKR